MKQRLWIALEGEAANRKTELVTNPIVKPT